MEHQPEESELTAETAAELWSAFEKARDKQPDGELDEGNNYRGSPRPKGHILFSPKSDAEPPHQN